MRLWDPDPGWLNTASYGLPPRPAWEALQSALTDWPAGRTSWEPWDECTGRTTLVAFSLVQSATGEIAPVDEFSPPPAAMALAGVRAAVRAGRARLSFHLFTTESDVDRALEALSG